MIGARVGLLEARMGRELAALVRRHGGVPRIVPAVQETRRPAGRELGELLEALGRGEVRVAVFLTGAGAAALFSEADQAGRIAELVEGLGTTINICRGQKPWRPLKQHGVSISMTVAEPYTTAEVLDALAPLDVSASAALLVHYGERNAEIAEALAGRGARVLEIQPYRWELPDDTGPLETFIEDVIAGELDAVAFTSQVQARHLFEVAEPQARTGPLRDALNRRAVVAAVGPTCASSLLTFGVTPRVVPRNPKMGPMVIALAEYLRNAASGP